MDMFFFYENNLRIFPKHKPHVLVLITSIFQNNSFGNIPTITSGRHALVKATVSK